MADNVTLPGTGESVATDDVAGVQYQRVKLVDGTLDSTAAIPGSATDGLLVNLGSNNDVTVTGTVTATLAAGTAYAGKVRPTDGTNDITFDTAGADAASNTSTRLPVSARLVAYNGTTWDRVALSFDGVGLTPRDRYWMWVNRDTGLVDRWDFVLKGSDDPPASFTWEGWSRSVKRAWLEKIKWAKTENIPARGIIRARGTLPSVKIIAAP